MSNTHDVQGTSAMDDTPGCVYVLLDLRRELIGVFSSRAKAGEFVVAERGAVNASLFAFSERYEYQRLEHDGIFLPYYVVKCELDGGADCY